MKHLKVFGCICYALFPKELRHKLDENSEKCIFMGYSSQSKGYRLYSLNKKDVIIRRDVMFKENESWDWKEKKVQSEVTTFNEEEENQEDDNEDHEGTPQHVSPITSPQSSPSNSSSNSPSSTPRKMRKA